MFEIVIAIFATIGIFSTSLILLLHKPVKMLTKVFLQICQEEKITKLSYAYLVFSFVFITAYLSFLLLY